MLQSSSLHTVSALVINEETGEKAMLSYMLSITGDTVTVTFRVGEVTVTLMSTPGQADDLRKVLRRAYQDAAGEPPARRLA